VVRPTRSAATAISGDGRYVAFVSSATNLVSGDTNNASDVFLHDRVARTTTRVSVGTTGVQGNLSSTNPSLSRDGSRIAFQSAAGNLIGGADTNSLTDVFVASRTGVTFRASQPSGGGQADGASVNAAMSGDGRSVAYESRATNLVSGDSSGRSDVFHHNLAVPTNRVTTRVVNGVNAREFNDPGNGDSGNPSISHDGAVVAFRSSATNLVSGDANGSVQDVFVADLRAPLGSQNRLASVAFTSGGANGVSAMPALSSNAQVATFGTQAANLVVGDTNGVMDVNARTLQ